MTHQTVTAIRIQACSRCERSIDLDGPDAGIGLRLTRCVCGQGHYALGTDPGRNKGDGGAYAAFSPVRHLSRQGPAALAELIRELGKPTAAEGDLRQDPRVAIALPIIVAPLDGDFRPRAEAQHAATIDVSASGIAFITLSIPDASFWLVDYGPAGHPGSQSVMRPLRCVSQESGLWKIAWPFASMVDEPTRARPTIVHTNRRM